MRVKKQMSQFIFFISLIVFISCSKRDSELSESVFIPDRNNPELPAYTECGYNTFGAFYNRSTYSYHDYLEPLNITLLEDELTFLFQGQYYGFNTASYNSSSLVLKIITQQTNVKSYPDMILYNDSIIDLTADDVTVEMEENGENKAFELLEGVLHIKKAQKVFVDNEQYGIILSGTFYLRFLENGLPSTISDGRFDISITEYNFYNLAPKKTSAFINL